MLDLPRPRLRGLFHQWAFFAAIGAGALLMALCDSALEVVSVWVYAAALVAMFGASALYHRYPWRTQARRLWARRLDHSTIFLFIAASYTPFALLALEGATRWVVLLSAWLGALLGITMNLLWIDGPRALHAAAYVAVGWVGVIAVPQMISHVGVAGTTLVWVGGALYTAGAVMYALKRPNPLPGWLGFHEVFHLVVIVAAATQFAAVALLVT